MTSSSISARNNGAGGSSRVRMACLASRASTRLSISSSPVFDRVASDYCRDLERAIRGIAPNAPVQASLRRKLDAVIAEQDDRARMAAGT